jgi:pimeloyl-ACP methyl ester carboxylesterase
MRHPTDTDTATNLHVETWGTGERVVLLHGSLATGADEWAAQQPLAESGFQLIVPDRRGYGSSPVADGEDYLVDADDAAVLMADGAHLVGHSYGGLGAMFAAAGNPTGTRSLTLLEAPVSSILPEHPTLRALDDGIRAMWTADLPDDEWVRRFLSAVGTDPDELPDDLLSAAAALVPVFRAGRPYFEATPPLDDIAAATYPKLVVSGGHDDGWEAMCAALAERIGADHVVIEGAGHEIQFTGPPLNDRLAELWNRR